MTSPKAELVIPVWPSQPDSFGYFGDQYYGHHTDASQSFWLDIRAIREGDKFPYFDESVRALGNVALYVWYSLDGTISIELRIHEAGNQTLREAEMTVKALKSLLRKAKAYPFGNFVKGSTIHAELTKVLAALGIQRSVRYIPLSDDVLEPIGIAVAQIAKIVGDKTPFNLPQAA